MQTIGLIGGMSWESSAVYYRDLKTGAYQWVDPPKQPIADPAEEYERYTDQELGGPGDRVIRDAPAGWPGQRAYGGRL